MRKIAGFLVCSACILAAATVGMPRLQASAQAPTASTRESAGDIQGSARLERVEDETRNKAKLFIRLADSGSQTITASRVDIQLDPLDGTVVGEGDVKFEFPEKWRQNKNITVTTYHYNAKENILTLFIATNGKQNLMDEIEGKGKEVAVGRLIVEADGPVTAEVISSTVAAGGARMEVPSVGGKTVELLASKEPDSSKKKMYPFHLKFELDEDPDYNFHIDTDSEGGYVHELFEVKIEKKDENGYSEIGGSPFTVQHGELEGVYLEDKSSYRVSVEKCPEGYKVNDAEHEITVNGGEASYTFIVSRAEQGETDSDGKVVTQIRFDILVKDSEGSPVSGVTLKLTGGGLDSGRSYTSNANGEIEVEDKVNGVLTGTLIYNYVVTHTPDGYDKVPSGQFTFSQSGATSFVVQLTQTSEKNKVPVGDTRDITLRVKDDKDEPVAGALLYVEGGGTARRFVTNSEGLAIADALPYGTYEVIVDKLPEGYEGTGTRAELTVSKDGAGEVTLTVRRSAEYGKLGSITVTVRDDKGRTVQGAEFRIEGSGASIAAVSGANGQFTLTKLRYGTYRITVTGLPVGYVAGDTGSVFVIGENSGPSFTFKVKTGSVRDVTVIVTDADGRPAGGVTVWASGNGVSLKAVTDANGRARFKDVKLGHYKLSVTGSQTGRTEFDLTAVGNADVSLALSRSFISGGSSRGSSSSQDKPAYVYPSYVVKGGSWAQDAEGHWTYRNGRPYVNEWAAIVNPYANIAAGQDAFAWFRFGKDGTMLTGWFTDEAGDTYYLHPISDGTLGHMYVGWQWIDDDGDGVSECYYFEAVSNGYRGRLYKSCVTPDGYTVNDKGQWMDNGKVAVKTAEVTR